ncbi:MAG TPA: hypothetical protein PLQ32_04725 [Flavihumibacter sp.]|nr:hypothetical protein [Bacteroidota bacterium]HPZ87380.1 hypothetical protein [Flavihumibacter sp.]HQD10013.1 hypothetical protein [Flavihumibacter sp.]
MEMKSNYPELKELSMDEALSINGGETLWYWIAYGIGAGARGVYDGVKWVHENLKQPPELIGVK